MESFVCVTQVEDSRVKEPQLKQEITTIKENINLPIGGSVSISVEFPGFQMDLPSGNGIPDQSLKQKGPLNESPLQGLLQERSSVEEWKKHLNYNSTEDTFPGFWHRNKMPTHSRDKTGKKLVVKKKPLKHKDLLQKPKLMCLQGKSKAKSQEWLKEILQNKEGDSENSNWVRSSDINFGFEAMAIESKQFPHTENVYDLKALNDECQNVQKEEQVTRNPRILAYDFQNRFECENLESDIHEARITPFRSSTDVNANELAGYLDNMLQIPREMSAMAKTMYT